MFAAVAQNMIPVFTFLLAVAFGYEMHISFSNYSTHRDLKVYHLCPNM